MARPPKDLGPHAEGLILARMAKGDSPEKAHAALLASGVTDVSVRTVARRMAALRPEANAARSPAQRAPAPPPDSDPGPPLPASPEDIPADASMETLLHFRRIARASIDAASDEGDLKLLGTLINTAGAVEDRIQRRTPRIPDDPNEAPDMAALAKDVEARLHKMIDMVLEER